MPIPKKGSIPGRSDKNIDSLAELGNLVGNLGIGDLFNNLFKSLGKTLESIQDLKLEDLEKLAEAQGNKEAKENIKKLKEKLGRVENETKISDIFGGKGLDLGKLINLATKQGGFSQKFAGGKGIIRGGIRGRILGKEFGGSMPFEKQEQQDQFKAEEVRPKRRPKTEPKKTGVKTIEIDPIEEDKNSIIIRGYMAGVDEKDIVCQIENKKT